MEISNYNLVSAIRTFNGEIITGELLGFRCPTEKMRKNNEYVGVVYVKGDRSYDVYSNSINYISNSITDFNKYKWIS